MGSNESQPEFMTQTDPSIASDALPPSAEPARSTRGFWALIATQFQGAYSDNILRNLLLSMIVGMGLAENQRESFVSLVTLMFSVPFVLFSMPGGWLADRFSKRQITIWTKVMEIGSMVVATIGLAAHRLPVSILCACPGGHAGGALRAVEVRPAPRIAAGQALVVGQRRHRAGDVSGHHCRHGHRRDHGGAASADARSMPAMRCSRSRSPVC